MSQTLAQNTSITSQPIEVGALQKLLPAITIL